MVLLPRMMMTARMEFLNSARMGGRLHAWLGRPFVLYSVFPSSLIVASYQGWYFALAEIVIALSITTR